MLVRMRHHITGYRNGRPWPNIGETIDLPDGEAADLIAARIAAPADPAPPESQAAAGDVDLDRLDKAALLELAAERGLDVNARLGERKLRDAIAEQLAATDSEETTDDDPDATDTESGSDGPEVGADDDAPPTGAPADATAGDAGLDALDKSELIEFAAERGIEIDNRWGDKRIRATIVEQLAAAGA